jgi:hypothetical protein
MLTTAPNATVELSMGRPRMKARTTMKHTALMGVPVYPFTLDQSCVGVQAARHQQARPAGMHWSRAPPGSQCAQGE